MTAPFIPRTMQEAVAAGHARYDKGFWHLTPSKGNPHLLELTAYGTWRITEQAPEADFEVTLPGEERALAYVFRSPE